MFILLIRPKILSLKNSLGAKIVLKRLPFVLLGIGFWLFLYIGSYKVLSYIRGIEFFGEILSEKLFSMTCFSLLGFLILSNIITGISAFYLSRDTAFFFTKPIEIREIIRLKTFESILNSSWMVISFVSPVFAAYGISYNAPIIYYIGILAAFLMFVLITAGIGISAAHVLTRLFPAKRTLNVLLGAGIIFFLILYFTMRSIIPHDLNTPEGLINSIMTFKTAAPLLPSYWVSETVFPILKGSGMKTFYMVVLLSNSAFFLLLSSTISLRLYRENIERIQPSGENKRRGFFRDFYPPNNAAIFYKDIKIFFRDTGQWSQVFIIGALIMVYIYNFRAIPINMISELTPFVREFMVMVNMLLAGLVLSAVAARFIYSSVSLEGEAFWIIKTSPVDMNRFLWAKFLYGCIPVTSLIVFLVFLTNLAINVKGLLMFISVGTTFMLCISISGLGTGFGAIYPKFRYENIASVSMSLGGMAFMLIAFGTAIITLSLEPWIFYIYNIRVEGGLNFIEKIQIAACLVSIVMVNAVVFYLPMRIGRMRLDKNKEITF